eukprot:SAG11_NODE_249_length_11637_cov_3.320073_4_plen_186_part_00
MHSSDRGTRDNPGTGKTTVARMMHKFMYVWGILPKDNFVERNGLELMGQYVGSTTPLVKEAVQDALGGCLFLDEAYALASQEEGRSGSASSSYAGEAIRTLLTEVENNRSRVMVVLAGYKDKMKRLLAADPGFPRRFPLRLHLEDYTAQDLALIAEKTAVERFGMQFAPTVRLKLFDEPQGGTDR